VLADLLEQTPQEEEATDEKLTRWPREARSTRRLCNRRPEAT
jgi:ferritin-like metal-binding protein YciE